MADVPTPALLTPRQLEVLELLAKGLTNREIAGVLDISTATAKAHVSAIIAALDVSNRTEAAMALQELGHASGTKAPEIPGFGGRPALLVLPFDNLSEDPAQDFFADGLVEDLTTRLAAWRWFPVIARNSAFAMRGRPIVVSEVARELGARYVIEGSTRRAGDRVRIHVQLIDGESGAHVFAKKLDVETRDVFQAQDEIVEAIYGALEPTLLRVEGLRALSRPAGALDTWEEVQLALLRLHEQLPASADEAIALLESAAAREPEFAPAQAALAIARFSRGLLHLGATQWDDAPPDAMAQAGARAAECFAGALEAGRAAVAADPLDANAFLALGAGLSANAQLEPARSAFEQAVELSPSSATACWALALLRLHTPEWRESGPLFERALKLSPVDPLRHHFEGGLATVCFHARDDEGALHWAKRSFEHEPAAGVSYRPLIPAALAHLGHIEEAKRECEAFRAEVPHWNLGLGRLLAPEGFVDRMLDGLRLAGWDVEGA